jgi:deoxyribodipyrimidine photolyase-related protein
VTGTLLVLFGDQLDDRSPILDDLDAKRDVVLMMEVEAESKDPPSHPHRTILFLSAMRHFAAELEERGLNVRYVALDDPDNTQSFESEIERAAESLQPQRIRFVRPGSWRVQAVVDRILERHDGEMVEDPHFLLEPGEFADWAEGRKTTVLEHFYRMMRKRFEVLIEEDGSPTGGEWNFDSSNREPFGGGDLPLPPHFEPDAITREVMELVEGGEGFSWPVSRAEALAVLDDFVEHRLAHFGTYQDAMVAGEPWMYHSLLSPCLNLKLLDPREVIERVVEDERAPINAVEGFVRQVLGWREFIRGVYWWQGPDYETRNALGESGSLPEFYWTGDTEMTCLRESIGQVLAHGYGHHIQRLMVTGNFALLAGVDPRAVNDWYLGMYVDAVDWVTAPNTIGMAMHADGGVVGTKPYVSTGRYIDRMSDYCRSCPYDPAKRTGDDACPFTTLYWDFLRRHRERFAQNRRMALMLKSLDRIDAEETARITARARELRGCLGVEPLHCRDGHRGEK